QAGADRQPFVAHGREYENASRAGRFDQRAVKAYICKYASGNRERICSRDAQELFDGLAYEFFEHQLNGSSGILARRPAGDIEGEIPHGVVARKIGADFTIFFNAEVPFDVFGRFRLAERRESSQFPLMTVHHETECLGEKAVKIPEAVRWKRGV